MDLKEEFERVVKFCDGRELQEIPVEEVREFTKGQQLPMIRLAVMWELNRCREDYAYFRSVETRTIRDLWYAVVKPFLSRVELEEEILKPKWGRYRTQALSAVMSEMALSGLCKYSDFKIEDRSRPKKRPYDFDKLKVGRFDEVVLFIEKDASFPKIEPLGDLLGFVVECGKGQQATAAIEGLIEYLRNEKSYLVFCITDFDYYGHLIMNSLGERSEALGLDAEFIRIGVDLEQVPQERRDVARFRLPLSSKPEREWAEEHAIEGIYGLEIEALTPPEIRGMVAEAVYEYCDPDELYKFLKDKALEGLADQVADELADGDLLVVELRGKISELIKKLDKIKGSLAEDFEKRAEEILEEQIEEIDDRPAFPEAWLKDQIISGLKYLSAEKFTDPGGISERVKELLQNG